MSTTYFLVFLVGLMALLTSTTAEHNGGAALGESRQMPFMSRFYSKAWVRIRNHPSKSTEKSLERAPEDGVMHLKPTGARRAMQKVEEKTQGAKPARQNVEEIRTDKTADCPPGARNKDAKSSGRAFSENKPEAFLPGIEKITMHKLDEAPTDKPAGYRAKTINIHRAKDMHQ